MKDQEQSDEMMTKHFEKRIVIIKNEKRVHRRHAVLEGVGENVHHGLDDRYIQSLLYFISISSIMILYRFLNLNMNFEENDAFIHNLLKPKD